MSYFLPRKAGLRKPCGRAAPWKNSPCERFSQTLFDCSPAELFLKLHLQSIHFGRWCRLRILLKPKRAGSNPARNASSSSSVVERRKKPLPLVPRSKFRCSRRLESINSNQHTDRWCRQQILRERRMRVRIPPRLQFASSKQGHSLMFCRRLFPGQNCFFSAIINQQQSINCRWRRARVHQRQSAAQAEVQVRFLPPGSTLV